MNAAHRQVGFGEAISLFFSNYANFSGRSSRGAYWWWYLASILLSVGIQIVSMIIGYENSGLLTAWSLLSMVVMLALVIPGFAVAVRRLHDVDKSGWWLLIGIIPLVGAIVLIYLSAQPGTRGANGFGPDVEAGRA